MKRTLFVVAVMVAFAASAASAATLSIVSDKTTYNVGETITLTVTGDDAGATSGAVQGRIDFNGAFVNIGTISQTTLVGPYGKWSAGTLPGTDNGGLGSSQFLFNQTSGTSQTATNLPGTLSIATLIASAAGTVNIDWHANQVDGFGLEFFGLSNAAGTSFTINGVVPEPTTAALLSIGLIGLALGGRRRS